MELPDPREVARQIGLHDRLVPLLGISIEEVKEGYARVSMVVEDKHLNAAEVCHGGAIFSLADLAFALSSNSHGTVALGIEASISYTRAAVKGDTLTAESTEESIGNKTATYIVRVKNQKGKTVAVMKGTVFRFGEPFPLRD